MLEREQLDALVERCHAGDGKALAEVRDLHPADIAHTLDRLRDDLLILSLFDSLDNEMAADTLPYLEDHTLDLIIDHNPPETIGRIVEEMDSDDAADVLADLDERKAEQILDSMTDEVGAAYARLMAYEDDTAGGIMQTELFSCEAGATVADAIIILQGHPEEFRETLYNIFVVDENQVLVGTIPVRDLLFNPPTCTLQKLIDEEPITVVPEVDQEAVAEIFKRYDLISLPVVDADGRLLGRILIDDIVDIIEAEASEDIIKMVGAHDESLESSVSSIRMAWYRFPWLFSSLAAGLATGVIIWQFKATISEALALTAFIPVVMGISGNVGAQSSALTIRGIAIGKIDMLSMRELFIKETKVGLMLGALCGGIAALAAGLWQGETVLGVVVGVSIFISILFAALLGTAIPLLFRQLKRDPAVGGGPVVLAFNDLTSIFIFFAVAASMLALVR
jgi:magnesium transporter